MRHEFVDYIPDRLEPDVLYVSIEHDTAVHSCFCGCGQEVVTPLSPAEWSLTYDGRTVSLSPSIGNWNFPCKSHYYIQRGRIDWATRFSDAKIEAVRAKDKADRDRLYGAGSDTAREDTPEQLTTEVKGERIQKGLVGRFLDWLTGS